MDYSYNDTPPSRLGESEIAVIIGLLGGDTAHESTVSLEFVSTKIQETRSLRSTLESTTWLEDDKLIARLSLVERLYDYSEGNVELVHHIVANTTVSPSTVKDVARNINRLGLAKSPDADADGLAGIDSLRRHLFKSEPTALLCGLIESGVIPLAPGLQEPVLAVLEHAVETGFNTRQQPLKILLDNGDTFESVSSQMQSNVRESVSAIVRLHLLVDEPAHIQVLRSQKYSSAHSIAQVLQSEFLQSVEVLGIDAAAAGVIWTRANAICVRNQGIWLEKLKEKHEIPFAGALLSAKNTSAPGARTESLANVSDLFPDLDQITDCPECSSVTSPAAYFVDLLHQLSKRPADPNKTSPTLLEELFKRRPDLGDLNLSCANTKALIPYIDLANEALESVAASGSGMVKDIYNADDDGDEYDDYINDDPSTMAENTNFDVYRKLVQPLVFPLATFPYNEAVESARAGLEGLGSSRNELLAIFRAPYRLVSGSMISRATVLTMAQSVLDRAEAAEYLGLVGEDYVAITHEAFQSLEYLDAVNNAQSPTTKEKYRSTIGVTTAGEYWGYRDDTSLLSDTGGLTCVRDQFLPRSALTFEETLKVLETGYLGRRLAITSTTGGNEEFSGLVKDMFLRHFPPSQKTNTPLQASECDELQAFIRLWRKVGWALEDLDAAVVMLLGTRRTGIDPIVIDGLSEIKRLSLMCNIPIGDILPLWGDMDTNWAKSVYARLFLQRRVTREDPVFAANANGEYLSSGNLLISDHRKIIMSTLLLSDFELKTILESAKWIGDSLTMRSISYIYRISLFSRMLGISPVQYPKVLSLLPAGFDLFANPRFTRTTLEEFQRLKKVGWTLDTELFVVGSVMDATGVPSGFIANTAISATLDIIRGNMSAGSQNDAPAESGVSENAQKYSQERVARVSAALFGEQVGSEVERFIQGTHRTTSHVSLQAYAEIPNRLRDKVQLSRDYKTSTWSVSLTGFLAKDEKQELANLIGTKRSDDLHGRSMSLYSQVLSNLIPEEHKDAFEDDSVEAPVTSWTEHAERLEAQTLRRKIAFMKGAAPALSERLSQKAVLKTLGPVIPALDIVVLETLLCDVIRVPSGDKLSLPSITAMQALCRLVPPNPEQTDFTGYFLPPGTDSYTFTARSDKAPNMVLNGLKVEFSGNANSGYVSQKAQRLAGDVWYSLQLSGCSIASVSFTVDEGSPSTPLSSTLTEQQSVQVVSDILVKLFRASIPISTYKLQREEVHYFQGLNGFDFGALRFANIKLLHAYADLRDTLPKPRGKDAVFPLMNLYKSFNSWDASNSLAKQLELATRWSAEDVRAVLAAKYPSLDETQVVGVFKDISENIIALCELRDIMGFFSKCRIQGVSPELLFSLAQPCLPGIPRGADTPSKHSSKKSSKASSPKHSPPVTPPPRVCTCKNCHCGYICPASHGGRCRKTPFGAAAESFPHEELTRQLESLDQSSAAAEGFCKTLEQSYQDAAALRLALLTRRDNSKQSFATAENKLRASRRTALVQYLLQQAPIKKCGISDADALCGYLLIDVMTGPSMRTSRLKQAISTVQTFMDRCILGLEQQNGISNVAIDREDYEFLIRYRLWEANRKLFLYPESWIDPTLRDDKSEQFQALEAAITQGKPTEDSVSQAVSQYIYSMHNVGNLEIQTYLWDRYDPSGKNSRLHFFARTMAAPWQFYYRTLDLRGDKGKQFAYWKPWEKMSVDIQVHDLADNSGWYKGTKPSSSGCYIAPAMLGDRLFLFLPHFTSSTLRDPMDASIKDRTPRDLADQKVSDSTKRKQWQMSMGWTEYRKGQWTKKQVSPDVVLIEGEVNDWAPPWFSPEDKMDEKARAKFPGIETFRFWVSQRSIPESTTTVAETAIVIDMERWVGPMIPALDVSEGCFSGFDAYKLGTFEWRGERLVFMKPSSDSGRTSTVPTFFSKLSWFVYENARATAPGNEVKGAKILMARPKITNESIYYFFTMSFNTVGVGVATGLVVDMRTTDRTECLMGYPPADANGTSYDWELGCFSNTVSPLLVHAAGGTKRDIYNLLSRLPSKLRADGFGHRKRKIPHELANPYSLYTWETAVHAISLLMELFMSSHQYELALTVARLLFDPAAIGANSDVTKCWKFIPFQDRDIVFWDPLGPDAGDEGKIDLDEYNRNKVDVHAVARGRPVAYMKRIVFKYIETLIALGDQLFRQNTLETIPLAIQRYLEASHLFGPPALPVPQIGKKGLLSYNKLVTKAGLDDYSNKMVRMELEFPFRANYVGEKEKLVPYIVTNYFCIPANPQVSSLRVLLADRLYKCRNSLDIDGHKQDLPLFEPPIDPGALVLAAADGLGPSAVLSDMASPMPRYRFVYILERALDICRELRETDARALAVKEKRDSEAMAALTSRHNATVLTLIMDFKKAQRAEELAAIETLEETRRSQLARLSFWVSLTGDDVPTISSTSDWQEINQSIAKPTTDDLRMSRYERNEMQLYQKAKDAYRDSNEQEHHASIIDVAPAIYLNAEPWGIGLSIESGPSILARYMRIGASNSAKDAQSYAEESQMSGMSARLENQLRERREAANQAGRDIKVTDRMLATARARVEVCDKDIKMQQQQLDNAAEMDEWLRSKYTSAQLYDWMDKQYGIMFQRAYLLCSELARQAQRAYFFERPAESDRFLREAGGGYWDSARHGMFSADNLWYDLKRMEMAFNNKKSHDFEIVKNISLRQVDPWQIMLFRETGHMRVSLPEFLFDIDFPGHYCRRIVSASLMIPCVVGPYTSLNCTLRLSQHRYRVSADLGPGYLENPSEDTRFRDDNIPISAVAIGSPTGGSFLLDFARDKYSPFEGAGVISTWQIDLPPKFRQFDYRTISDVVLQLRYTASDGGAMFASAASNSVQEKIGKPPQSSPALLSMLVNVPSDYATSWYGFRQDLANRGAGTLQMPGMGGLLPFWTQQLNIMVDSITVIFVPPPTDNNEALKEMKISGYQVGWEVSTGFGEDSAVDACTIIKSGTVGKEMSQDWTVSLPNDGKLKFALESMWILVSYYAG